MTTKQVGALQRVLILKLDDLKLFADASYAVGNSSYLYGNNSAFSVVNGDIEQNRFTAVQVSCNI